IGRPVGSRTAFSAAFCKDLVEVWSEEGREAMVKTAKTNPIFFFATCARLRDQKRNFLVCRPPTTSRVSGTLCRNERRTPLARPGQTAQARELLTKIYCWFIEGFDTRVSERGERVTRGVGVVRARGHAGRQSIEGGSLARFDVIPLTPLCL